MDARTSDQGWYFYVCCYTWHHVAHGKARVGILLNCIRPGIAYIAWMLF